MKKTLKALIVLILVGLMFAVISCDTTTGGGKGKSQYKVDIEISYGSGYPYVNAHVWEGSRHIFVENAKISIDGIEIEKQEGEWYFTDFGESWEEGSTHSYKIETPDGVSEEGTFTISLVELKGATCEYSEDKIVKTYTVSPPTGGWPQNSYLELYYTINNGDDISDWALVTYPTGNYEVPLTIYNDLENISYVGIISAIKTPYELKNYYAGSALTFIGPETQIFEINLED